MPLVVEILDEPDGSILTSSYLLPGEPPGTVTTFSTLTRTTELIGFTCFADDKHSTVFQYGPGAHTEEGGLRMVEGRLDEIMPLRNLTDGQEHSLSVWPRGRILPVYFHFKHVQVNFGMRSCPICQQEIEAPTFGAHVLSHGDIAFEHDLLTLWRTSLDQSIEAAKDFPRLQEKLRDSLAQLRELEHMLHRSKRHQN